MDKLNKFGNNLFELVVDVKKDEPLFDVETVAKSLGFTEIKNNKEYVRWRTINSYLKKYVSQEVAKGDFISEPLVYKLAFKANNALAEKFQDWLAVEVIPSIRKHGGYLTPEKIEEALLNPDTLIQLANNLKEERTKRLVAEQQVMELKPKADYYDNILLNKGLVTISTIAKNYGYSAGKFNELLHELGIQFKQGKTWLLYQKHATSGYTHSEPFGYKDKEGKDQVTMNTKWTTKGHIFLYQQLKKNKILPMIEQIEMEV